VLPILLQSWSRSKPSAPSRTPMPFLSQCSLDPTCDILLSPLFSLSNHSLLFLPSSLLHLDILVFARLVPSLEVLTPPAGLFPLDSCAPAPVAFRLWLPSSCPGSRIANPSFFLNIYPMTYMLASKPCLSLSPSSPSIKSITLRIVTPQHSILLLQ
jgi:hypothetical protein